MSEFKLIATKLKGTTYRGKKWQWITKYNEIVFFRVDCQLNLGRNSSHVNYTTAKTDLCLTLFGMDGCFKRQGENCSTCSIRQIPWRWSTSSARQQVPKRLHTLGGAGQNQPESDINHAGGHVGERDPQELGVPPGTVPGARVSRRQGVLHAVGHLAEVGVAYGAHDQTLHLDVWKLRGLSGIKYTWTDITLKY